MKNCIFTYILCLRASRDGKQLIFSYNIIHEKSISTFSRAFYHLLVPKEQNHHEFIEEKVGYFIKYIYCYEDAKR